MKYLVRIFIFSTLLLSAMHLCAQVSSIQYAILLNSESSLIDCYMYVHEGQANTSRERVQFNAQYSLMIPTGAEVDIASSYMPLVANQNLAGGQPLKWIISSKLNSPEINPGFDFYGITPTLAPAGFYNNLKQGDLVKLFSLKITGEEIDLNMVKIYDNDSDPKSFDQGMKNGDFSNGFTMGGYQQLYNGIININQEEANYTSLDNNK